MAKGDLATDGQTQSCPSNCAFGRKEWLEEMRQIVWGHAWTGVGDQYLPRGLAMVSGLLGLGGGAFILLNMLWRKKHAAVLDVLQNNTKGGKS